MDVLARFGKQLLGAGEDACGPREKRRLHVSDECAGACW
jgi:hypothetical protein